MGLMLRRKEKLSKYSITQTKLYIFCYLGLQQLRHLSQLQKTRANKWIKRPHPHISLWNS